MEQFSFPCQQLVAVRVGVRGKVARYLAGKASIAVRIDHFDGEKLTKEQVSKIHKEAESIKMKFPKPPKRK